MPDAHLPNGDVETSCARDLSSEVPEPAEADALPSLESAPREGSGDPLDRPSPLDDPASLASHPVRAAARAGPARPRGAPDAGRGKKRKANPDKRGGARHPSDPSDIPRSIDAEDSRDSRGASDDDVAAASSPPEAPALPAARPLTHNHAPANGAPERQCKVHRCDAACEPGYFFKNRVCKEHTRADEVRLSAWGPRMRFCTRCTTFHPLSAFSEGFRVCAAQLRADTRRRAAKSGRVSRVDSHPEGLSAIELETLEEQIQSEVDELRRARVGEPTAVEAFYSRTGTGLGPGLEAEPEFPPPAPSLGPGLEAEPEFPPPAPSLGPGLEAEPEFPPPAPSRYFRFFAPPIESVRWRGHHASIGARIFSRFSAGQASSDPGALGALGAVPPSPSWLPPHPPQYARVHPGDVFPPAHGRMNPHPRASDDSFSVGSDLHATDQEMRILAAWEPRGEPRTWPEAILVGGHEAPGSRSGEEESHPPRLSNDGSDHFGASAHSNCFVGISNGPFHATKVDRLDGRVDTSSRELRDDDPDCPRPH